jgi:Glycosyl hydrolase catalytic core
VAGRARFGVSDRAFKSDFPDPKPVGKALYPMIRRPGKALLALICALSCVVALPAAASAKVAVGISDQNTGFFSDPHFLSLKIHEARLVVPWDVATARSQRGTLNYTASWLAAAQSAGVKPLISFGDDTLLHGHAPSLHTYVVAVQAFIKRFPQVKQYTAWNEPDFTYVNLARNPQLAASYFNQLAYACHHCTILAGDMFMPAPQLGSYLRQYVRYLRVKPAGWALHDYRDIRGRTTAQLTTLERYTKGPIWLDETGGIERRGHWQYRNQSATSAGRDEAWLFGLPNRFHRIAYIFHYQWQAVPGAGWDSGLLDSSGHTRPAYGVVAKYLR